MPRALRVLGAFLTVMTFLGLAFFLIVVEARDRETSVRRDVAYGELKRIEHALRDISDVSRAKACSEVTQQSATTETTELSDERVEGTVVAAVSQIGEDAEAGATKAKKSTSADAQKCSLKNVKLTFEGQQARDRRTVLSTEADGPSRNPNDADADGKDQFEKINERLSGNADTLAVTDIAIITRDWDFAISLRGDAAWPANLQSILESGEPIGWNPQPQTILIDDDAKGKQREIQPETLSLGGPVKVNMGGAEVVVHAIPLNIRRALLVGRTGFKSEGQVCPPRECYLVGIVRDRGLMSDISSLSPLTRASFVAAIVLLLLLVPIGKLWLIDKRSSMNWPDVAAIIASVPLAIATTFVISIVWAQWLELRQNFDSDAQGLATQLAADSDREISETNSTLIDLVKNGSSGTIDSGGEPKTLRDVQVSKGMENVFAVSDQGALLYLYGDATNVLRPAPENCEPEACWTPLFNYLITNPPSKGVASRRYFRRAAERTFLEIPGGDRGVENYVASVVPSLVEGNSTLISMLQVGSTVATGGDGDGAENDWRRRGSFDPGLWRPTPGTSNPDVQYVLANRQPFFSRDVPLPEGYSFAVLDTETLEVLQHSDPSRAGSERWGERVDDVPLLRRVLDETMRTCSKPDQVSIETREVMSPAASKAFTMRYTGREVRLSAAPSCRGNWAIVVWYPAEMAERLAITPAALSVGLILLIGFVTAVFAVALGMIDRQRLVAIFWPDVRRIQFAKMNGRVGRIGQLDVLAVCILLVFVSLIQVTLLRGDSSFWQIFAMICATLGIQLALANTPQNSEPQKDDLANRQSNEDGVAAEVGSDPEAERRAARKERILRRLTMVSIAGYLIFSALAFSSLGFAQTHSKILYLVLTLVGAGLLIALLNSAWFERAGLARVSKPMKWWFSKNVGLKPSIFRQTVTQGLIVTLVTVIPSILAYRTASTVIFEEFLAQDVVAVSQVTERRKDVFEDQCSRIAGEMPGASAASAECVRFASGLGSGGIDRALKRISRHSYFGVTPAQGEGDATARALVPEATNSRQLLQRAVGRAILALDQPRVNALLSESDTGYSAHTGPSEKRDITAEVLEGRIADIDKIDEVGTGTDIDKRAAATQKVFDSALRVSLQVAPFIVFGLMGLLGYAYLCRALFGMGLFEFRSLHPRPEFDRSDIDKMSDVRPGGPPPLRLYVNYPFDKFEQLKGTLEGIGGYNYVDLARVDDAESQLASIRTRNRPWIVVGLMRIIGVPSLRRDALDFLERLLGVEGVQVHFFSEMLPIERLQQVRELERLTHVGDTLQQDIDSIDEARHWALLLAQFVTVRWDSYWELRQSSVPGASDKDTPDPRWLRELIRTEFEAIPNDLVRKQRESFLEELEVKSGDEPGAPKHGRNPALAYRTYAADDQPLHEQVIEYLANVLSDYYQMKWIGSTREEQILMYHLANNRFVKTTDFRTINSLINRELIKRDPNPMLMNESFAFWVRTNENPETFHAYRQMVEQASPWSQLRLPMLVFVVVAAGALAFLDQGTVGSVISLIPAIAAAIPVFASQASKSRSVAPS